MNNIMNRQNPVEYEVFEIFDGVSDLTMTAHNLKAVTIAFEETFTEDFSGADIEAIKQRPEHFCYLFNVLRNLVYTVEEQAVALEDMGNEYLTMKRAQQAAESPAAPHIAQTRGNPCGDLDAPTGPAQTV